MRHLLSMLCGFVTIVGGLRVSAADAPTTRPADWPVEWVKAWGELPATLRPLQIVHGVAESRATPGAMKELKDLGLGGIVCNVDFTGYLVDEAKWATLVKAVESCHEVGMRVWLYDEKGYPSGSAGGLVLKGNRGLEAMELAFDAGRGEPLVVRPAYEHTHASNNFAAARRYINLISAPAVKAFITTTHEAYWRRLEKYFGNTIEATFTDEPSLMAVNLGQLPEKVRKAVPVEDALDESVKPLPCVPWVDDLAEKYHERYGADLMPVRASLFGGETEADREVRRRYWGLIADLIAERYFGQIGQWCAEHHVASSGHSLWEEMPLHHVPLEGDALKVLRRVQIPGLDVLSSDPEACVYGAWMAAALPGSAALIEGRRRVMTEVSDFSQQQAGQGAASLALMQATAAWQAALGVTEFTLYYDPHARPAAEYRAYGEYVGRLNAVLREARPSPTVLLYYPIYDLWGEYKPVAEPLKLESQSQRAQTLVNSFLRTGQQLLTAQIPFALADHEVLAGAEVQDGGLWVGKLKYDAVVLPAGVELPPAAREVVERFQAAGGRVAKVEAGEMTVRGDVLGKWPEAGRLRPGSDRVVVGRFVRDGREVWLVVNVGAKEYAGSFGVTPGEAWTVARPADGRVERARFRDAERVELKLGPREAVILVGGGR